jgi:hypothetical protein
MLSVPNDNQQCGLRNVQLWLDDEGVGAPYTNGKRAVARARASYLESTDGEQARARSSRLRTYLGQMLQTRRSWIHADLLPLQS